MLYIIYSRRSIQDITSHLLQHGSEDDIGPSRIVFYKGNETNRTMIVLSPALYEQVKDNRNHDFSIVPYQLRDYDKAPNNERSLFLPLPKELKQSECRQILMGLLDTMARFGFFKEGDYKVNIPLYTRTSDAHKGLAFIHFEKEVPQDSIAYAKAFLHGYENIKCFWSTREKKRVKKKEEKEKIE